MAHPGIHAAARPNAAALIMAETRATLTWADLHELTVRWANPLHGIGLRPGDAVVMCLENRFEFVTRAIVVADSTSRGWIGPGHARL